MEDTAQVFIKSFTRYFIPGLIGLVIAIYLPLYFFTDNSIFQELNLFNIVQVLVFSIVLGYLLDSFGAYGWTLCFRGYKAERAKLTVTLRGLLPDTDSDDPDQYLAQLWLLNEEIYDRLFVERAEWVMILESSAALLLAGIVFIIALVIDLITKGNIGPWQFPWELPIAIIFILLSYLSSRKGIQRMSAHNMKLIRAIKSLVNNPITSTQPEVAN